MSLNETINNLGDSIINLVDKKTHRGLMALEQGEVGYDKEVWSDINKYKHSTFDINKFTAIRNNEQISDFVNQKGQYFAKNSTLISTIFSGPSTFTSLDIYLKFTTGSDLSDNQQILNIQGTQRLWLHIKNGKLYLLLGAWGTEVTSVDDATLTLEANTTYYVHIQWDGTIYKLLVSLDDTNWNVYQSYESTRAYPEGAGRTCFGHSFSSWYCANFFMGTIDLNYYKCYKDGVLVEDYALLLNGFYNENVDPIPENGIINGITQYRVGKCTFSKSVAVSKSFEITCKLMWQATPDNTAFGCDYVTSRALFSATNSKIEFLVWHVGATAPYSINTNKVFEHDKWYIIKFGGNGNNFYGRVYDEDGTLITEVTKTLPGTVCIRQNNAAHGGYLFNTGNDLSCCQIIVDGQEVFNGNKTGVDIIKPDNFDKMNNPTITENGLAYSTDPSVHSVRKRIDNLSGTKKIKVCWGGYYIRGSHIQTPCAIVLRKNNSNIMSACTDFLIPDGVSRIRWAHLNDIRYSSTNLCSDNDITITDSDNAYYYIENTFTANSLYFDVWRNGRYIGRGGGPLSLTAIEDADSITYAPLGYNTVNLAYENWVNLSDCKLYINDKLIWQPMLRIPYTETKAGYKVAPPEWRSCLEQIKEEKGVAPYYTIDEGKKQNFVIIGNNTVINNGIISGFNGSSYITTGYSIGQKPFKIEFKAHINGTSGAGILLDNPGNGWYPVLLRQLNTICSYSRDASDNPIHDNLSIAISANTDYYISYEFTGTQYILKVREEGGPWKIKTTESSTFTRNIEKQLLIGKYADFSQGGFDGSIDLSTFKIYVDGELVWTPYTRPSYTLPQGDVYSVLSAKANSSEISHYAMPSEVYDELTLGTSGDTYTAPANGYFFLDKSITDQAQSTTVTNTNTNLVNTCAGVNLKCVSTTPARKGDVVSVTYTAAGATNAFKFIYAEGSKGEKQ